VKDATAEFRERDLPRTQELTENCYEVHNNREHVQLLLRLGWFAEAHALLESMGFAWSADGFAQYDSFFPVLAQTLPGHVKDADGVFQRLLLYSASPQSATLDAEVNTWIPTPVAIAQHERNQAWCQMYPFMGVLGLAASAFLRLDRDADAMEAARILLSPEHHCIQPSDFAHGHGVLGQLAARRGDAAEADGHFGRALKAATSSRFPLLEVVAARDWQRAVPASGAAADAAIDAACAKMGKTRVELALVL
jgi:hypothetical protein